MRIITKYAPILYTYACTHLWQSLKWSHETAPKGRHESRWQGYSVDPSTRVIASRINVAIPSAWPSYRSMPVIDWQPWRAHRPNARQAGEGNSRMLLLLLLLLRC